MEKITHLTSLDTPFVFYNELHTEHYHEELEVARIYEDGIVSINHVEYQVEQNDLIFLNPFTVHSFQCPYKSILINLESIGLNVMDVIAKNYIYPIYQREIVFPPVIKSYEILNVVTQLFLTLDSKEELYEFELKELTYLLFHELFKLKLLEKNDSTNVLTFEKIAKAINYIEEHYNEELNIEQLASLCDLSSSHFMRVFKERTNYSCNEYLIEYRLKKALELLEYSDHSIKDIIGEIGFRNVSNFNRLFKKHYGLTPEKYRLSKRRK